MGVNNKSWQSSGQQAIIRKTDITCQPTDNGLCQIRFQHIGPGRDAFVRLIAFVYIVNGKPHKSAVDNRNRRTVRIVTIRNSPHETASAIFQIFIKHAHAVAESIAIRLRITASPHVDVPKIKAS